MCTCPGRLGLGHSKKELCVHWEGREESCIELGNPKDTAVEQKVLVTGSERREVSGGSETWVWFLVRSDKGAKGLKETKEFCLEGMVGKG